MLKMTYYSQKRIPEGYPRRVESMRFALLNWRSLLDERHEMSSVIYKQVHLPSIQAFLIWMPENLHRDIRGMFQLPGSWLIYRTAKKLLPLPKRELCQVKTKNLFVHCNLVDRGIMRCIYYRWLKGNDSESGDVWKISFVRQSPGNIQAC